MIVRNQHAFAVADESFTRCMVSRNGIVGAQAFLDQVVVLESQWRTSDLKTLEAIDNVSLLLISKLRIDR